MVIAQCVLVLPKGHAHVTGVSLCMCRSSWGAVFGWAQLLSLYLARTATGCARLNGC